MDLDFRLVCQSRHHHPHGIYSGTTNCYALQVREKGGKWQTFQAVNYDDLPEDERIEIARSANSATAPREQT
jgi:hypothetical protein